MLTSELTSLTYITECATNHSLRFSAGSVVSRTMEIRHPETLRQIDEKVKHWHPVDVYDSMSNEQSVNAPRDLQQVPYCTVLRVPI